MTVGHGLQEYSRGKMGVIGISEAGFYCDDTYTNYKYICTTLNHKSNIGSLSWNSQERDTMAGASSFMGIPDGKSTQLPTR